MAGELLHCFFFNVRESEAFLFLLLFGMTF